MPVLWPGLQSGFTNFLQSQKAEGLEDTAKEIAKLYHDAVQQAMPAVAPGATVLGLDPRPIEDGFLDSFQQIFDAEKARCIAWSDPQPARCVEPRAKERNRQGTPSCTRRPVKRSVSPAAYAGLRIHART